ncbi:hypothetical protein [uncultured Parabacteroides sp.]|uniref:hypothetical protein n=1 Tax=uncultured Parabacteroides sp. TaxID=512312 RepID=UPI002804C719|nr:hypothetical protein [uncultured Parabacteroides sp.]
MDTIDILNKEFFTQDFVEEQPSAEMLNRYKDIARNYARMENAVAVLSIECFMFLSLLMTRCGWLYAFTVLYCLILLPNA